MNLRAIANGMTSRVRPNTSITWRRSTGWTQDPDTGTRTAQYADRQIIGQIQAVSSQDLQLLGGFATQGYHRAIYINGHALGTLRNEMKGGDLFIFGGQNWKAVSLPEDWDDAGWCKIIVTQTQQGGDGADIPE